MDRNDPPTPQLGWWGRNDSLQNSGPNSGKLNLLPEERVIYYWGGGGGGGGRGRRGGCYFHLSHQDFTPPLPQSHQVFFHHPHPTPATPDTYQKSLWPPPILPPATFIHITVLPVLCPSHLNRTCMKHKECLFTFYRLIIHAARLMVSVIFLHFFS